MVIHWKWRVIPAYGLMMSAICLIIWVFLHIASKQPPIDEDIYVRRALPYDTSDKDAVNKVISKPRIPQGGNDRGNLKEDDKKGNNVQGKDILPHLMKDGLFVIPNNTILHAMSWKDLSILYHKYLSQSQHICEDISRIGRVTDGGWDICNDPSYKPVEPCYVYSFGIGDDFSFDDGMIRAYGCEVFSFDPSMKMESKLRASKAHFYKQGLADSDRTLPNGWVMSRMDSIRYTLKHTKKKIHTVKLDIEEWEWEVLPDFLAHDSLKTVTQLLIELHQCDGCSKYDPLQDDKEPPRERYIHMLGLLRQLYELEFRIFHHHHNPACRYVSKFTMEEISACSELGFVRVS